MNKQTALAATRPINSIEAKADGPIGWLRDEIDRIFEDFPFSRQARSAFNFPAMTGLTKPAIELVEKDGGYSLTVEVPGIDEKDLDVEIAEGVLTVSGEKREESETKDSGYLISERSYGSFSRQITLPTDIDPDTIQAKVQSGVLKLDIKKDKNAAGKTRKIAIN
jgi:HSP20 family protein